MFSVDLKCPEMTKKLCLVCQKSRTNCCPKNVKNHAIFVEEFSSDFYAQGRFMKYSMPVQHLVQDAQWTNCPPTRHFRVKQIIISLGEAS